MEILIEQAKARVPITILRIKGDLDGTSYQKLIDVGQAQYKAGARDFLIDLSETSYLSSAGLVALHTIVKLARGEQSTNADNGWAALHAIESEQGGGKQHVGLLNPQPKVNKVLEMAGVKTFLPVFKDLQTAIASF